MRNEEQETFSALGVSSDLVAVLDDAGLTSPFPVQRLCIPDALAGRDVCGKAKTGSGKTLAFGLPLVERVTPVARAARGEAAGAGNVSSPGRPTGLVLVPTRELATQVSDVLSPLLRARSLRLVTVYGGAQMGKQIAGLGEGAEIVVATPGRLIDLIDRKVANLSDVGLVVLDEADRMADMGFMPQVQWVLRRMTQDHQTLLFSATL
ncbi:MAG TPA: DEAD/DEAH box helicase, partial [Acidimicrobiales bacterium]|nr:DEAD/DEAH box helicase [Acidimicrobiales bacterium]